MLVGLDKTLFNILNQHGWDAMIAVVYDTLEHSIEEAYESGKDDGWRERSEAYAHLIDESYHD